MDNNEQYRLGDGSGKQTIRILHTDPTILGTYIVVVEQQSPAMLAADRINYVDESGAWHTADVVRRIFDTFDALWTFVVED